MKIDTSIWGDESTWIDPYNNNNAVDTALMNADIKINPTLLPGSDAQYTLFRGSISAMQQANKLLTTNTIDNSICPWGISTDAMYASPNIMRAWQLYENGWTGQFIMDHIPAFADSSRKNIPLYLGGNPPSSSDYTGIKFNEKWMPNSNPGSYGSAFANRYRGKPALQFNYSKIMACIYVVMCRYNDTGNIQYRRDTFKKWINEYRESYPHIMQISVRWYFGKIDDSGNYRTGQMNFAPFYLNYFKNFADMEYYNGTNNIQSAWNIDYYELFSPWRNTHYESIIAGCVDVVAKPADNIRGGNATIYNNIKNLDQFTAYATSPNNSQYYNARIILDNYKSPKFKILRTDTATSPTTDFSVGGVWENPDPDEILHQVAYLGFWFTVDENVAMYGIMGESDDIYLPIFNDNGIPTGEYVQGADAKNQKNYEWGTDVYDKNKYSPSSNPDADDNSDTGDISSRIHYGEIISGVQYYALNATQMRNLIAFINEYDLSDGNDWNTDFHGVNPFEYIVSANYYPYPIIVSGAAEENIKLASIATNATGIPVQYNIGAGYSGMIASSSRFFYDFGTIRIDSYYGDFRDFAPYTSMELYIPFCGTYTVDPAYWMGHNINIRLQLDIATGAATAYIFRDDLIANIMNGQIGIQIPFTATNMGAYQNAIVQAKNSLLNSEYSMVRSWLAEIGGVATVAATIATGGAALPIIGGAAMLAGGIINQAQASTSHAQAEYNLQHIAPHTGLLQSASPANAALMDWRARLLIIRSQRLAYSDLNAYAHTVGYACDRSDVLDNFSGYTIVSNVDVSGVTASPDEIEIIITQLKNGVYL